MELDVLRAALRSAGTGVWEWDIDHDRLIEADLGFQQLGYAPDEIEPSQAAWEQLMHPDDRATNEEAYQRHVRGEVPLYLHRYRVRARDGGWRWFEERGQIVERHPDGRPKRMLGTQTDVTAQLALHAAAERMQHLPAHVPGMLFQCRREADGRTWLPYASERCQELLGLAPELLRADAAPLLRLVRPDQRQAMLDSIAASAASLRPWRLQFCVTVDGQPRCLRGSATPQHVDGGATLWHGYIEDVTELLELEQAQRDKAAAEAASRAKTEFLSRVSHELRTPLNAVMGFAQLLEVDGRDPPSAGQRARVGLILDAGRHLLQMIGDLLDLTRAESGALALRPEAVDLAALAAECAAMLRPQADAAGVALGVEAAPGLRAWADPTRLRQVLLNLLSNAIKYNRRGGWVRLRAEGTGGRVRLTVQDTGIGIGADDLPRLFEPFFRGQALPADGAGIGLAVTRSLVLAMGGTVDVASVPGEGSTFTVALPGEGGSLQSTPCTTTS